MSDGTEKSPPKGLEVQEEAEVISRAWEEFRNGRREEGLELLQRTLKRSPTSVPIHIELATMYQELANPNKMIEYCAKALKIDPQNSMACTLMGWAYTSRQETNKAVPLLKKAIQLDPNNTYAYEDLGRIVLTGMISASKMNSEFLNASICFAAGDDPVKMSLLEDGIKYYERGCRSKRDWWHAYYRMGVLYYYAGQRDKVRDCINAAAARGHEPAQQWLQEL